MAKPYSSGIILPAATAAAAPLRIPAGTAPSSPTDGDIWTTTAGVFARVNGSTKDLTASGGGGPFMQDGGALSFQYDSGSPGLQLRTDAAAGYQPPTHQFTRNGASGAKTPDSSTIGMFRWDGKDSSGSYDLFAAIQVDIGTNASGGAPSSLLLQTAPSGGNATNALRLNSDQSAELFGTLKPVAGTTTVAPIDLAAGSLLSTPVGGAIEYDGALAYFTPDGSAVGGRAVNLTKWFARLASSNALSNDTSVQSIFGKGLNLPTGYYRLEMYVQLTTGTTSHTVAVGLGGSGGLAITGARWTSQFINVAAGGTPGNVSGKWNTSHTLGTPEVVSPASTAASKLVKYEIVFGVSTAGKVIPQIKFSAAPGGTNQVQASSWVMITPLSTSDIGDWS